MMGKNILAGLFCLLLATGANAALINVDLNAPGDELLVLDTDTGLEWALVTRTGTSVDFFNNSSIYAGAGFTVATASDLLTFFTNAGAPGLTIGVFHGGGATYDPAASLIYDLMKVASPFTEFGGNPWIHAWYDNGNGSYDTGRVGDFGPGSASTSFMIGNNNYSNQPSSFAHPAYSVWAHRPASVSEPHVLALIGIGLLGGLFARRRAA